MLIPWQELQNKFRHIYRDACRQIQQSLNIFFCLKDSLKVLCGLDKIKQGVKPGEILSKNTSFFVTESYSERDMKVSEHAIRSLSMPKTTRIKYLYDRNCPKSFCALSEFQNISLMCSEQMTMGTAVQGFNHPSHPGILPSGNTTVSVENACT